MNPKKLISLLMVASLLLAGAVLPVRAVTISQWTFETSLPTTAGPISPEVGSGTGTAVHANATTYSNPVGNGSSESWSANNWSAGDYWQFQISSASFVDIFVSFDQTSSGTGPRDFKLTYSTDGATFLDFAANSYTVLNGSGLWNSTTHQSPYFYSFDLSAIGAIENATSLTFRLVDMSTTSASGGTVAAGGTDRIDNFTVSGTAVPTAVPDSLPWPVSAATFLAIVALAHRFSGRRCVS